MVPGPESNRHKRSSKLVQISITALYTPVISTELRLSS
jgi:hypothetical protein